MVIAPLDVAVAQAIQKISRDAVPDMPDRIIAATALHLNAELVTRDHRLQAALKSGSLVTRIAAVIRTVSNPYTTLAAASLSPFIFSA
jgi:predicted nucleic acid-binding protein